MYFRLLKSEDFVWRTIWKTQADKRGDSHCYIEMEIVLHAADVGLLDGNEWS